MHAWEAECERAVQERVGGHIACELSSARFERARWYAGGWVTFREGASVRHGVPTVDTHTRAVDGTPYGALLKRRNHAPTRLGYVWGLVRAWRRGEAKSGGCCDCGCCASDGCLATSWLIESLA